MAKFAPDAVELGDEVLVKRPSGRFLPGTVLFIDAHGWLSVHIDYVGVLDGVRNGSGVGQWLSYDQAAALQADRQAS